MQTTLLGLAIALILALIAALVGPLFIDWTRYRPQFEAEASRLAGIPVRVTGAMDVRLLPSPSLVLGGVEAGASGGASTLRARSAAIEFSLGALMRGQLRATQAHLSGAEIALSLDRDGKIAPGRNTAAFSVDALAIDRLTIEDSRVVLADAVSGSRLQLDKLGFNGDVRSLAGAFRGDGSFVKDGGLTAYRIAATRGEDNALRVKVTIEPADRPFTAELDGALTFESGAPRFEGAGTIARSVGTVLSGGRTLVSEPAKLTAKIKATPASALFEQVEMQYGAEERAARLTGTAQATFGARPRLDAVLSARQIDADRVMISPDSARGSAFAILKAGAESFGSGLRLPWPARIGMGIDSVTLAGSNVQNLRGDLVYDGDAWSFDNFELRGPGGSAAQFSGRFDFSPGNLAFAGPVDVSTADPRAFFAWLTGRGDLLGTLRAVRARGEVNLRNDGFAIEKLDAEIDRRAFQGRIAYGFATLQRKAQLDAELRAADLDADGMLDLARTAFAGSGLGLPAEASLALEIGHATIAGLDARNAQAKLKFGAGGIDIERLAIADLGGAALSASGRVDMASGAPRGNITLDIDATRGWAGVTALAGKLAPDAAEPARTLAERLGPSILRASLNFDDLPDRSGRARIRVALGGGNPGMTIAFSGHVTGDPSDLWRSDVSITSAIEGNDSLAIARLIGLERIVPAGRRAARLSINATGPLASGMLLDARFVAADFNVSATGPLKINPGRGAEGTLDISVKGADLGGLRAPRTPLPATLSARANIAGRAINLDNINASVGGAALRGRLALFVGADRRLDGEIEADAVDASAVIAAAAGMPPSLAGGAWSAEPFGEGFLPALDGTIELRAGRAAFAPSLIARDMRATLKLTPGAASLEDLQGVLAGGKLSASLSLRRQPDGIALRGRAALSGADASIVVPSDTGVPVVGRISLQVEAEGTGLTPKALIGALGGSGTLTLQDAQLAGLNARAFQLATQAADQTPGLESAKLRDIVGAALDRDRLKVKWADGAISIGGGQARLGTIVAQAEGAELSVSGIADLADRTLDARLVLSNPAAATPAGRPEIVIGLKGPTTAPRRNLDVTQLAGWLALRAVDQQTRRVEEGEKLKAEVERQRAEAERQRQEEEQRAEAERQRLDAERARGESETPAAPPQGTQPANASGTMQGGNAAAPLLPPPIEIRPAPRPPAPSGGAGAPLDLLRPQR